MRHWLKYYNFLHTGDLAVQEQTELIDGLPMIPAGQNVFYTPQSMNSGYPDNVGNQKNFPKLLFGFHKQNKDTQGKSSKYSDGWMIQNLMRWMFNFLGKND